MKTLIALLATLALTAPAFGKIFDRCSLAAEMQALGVPESELAIWVCIAEHESTFRTNIVGKPNPNGTKDYGIFQINNKYWCQPKDGSHSYNGCKLSCDALLTDDIKQSVTCARLVKKEQGWKAWSTWKFCQGKLHSIDGCF